MATVMSAPQTFEMKDKIERNVHLFARTDTLSIMEHVWEVGSGEVELHTHHLSDAGWLVTKGEVTFFDENNEVIAKLGKDQGVFIPRGVKYSFANSGNEPLVMFRASSRVAPLQPGQLDRDPPLPYSPGV